jgi:hypothetical protein
MAFCIECKCCEAQPDFTKCVFCEDGVACPGRQRAARNIVMPAPSRALIPPTPTESKRAAVRRIRNPRSPWRGEAGLHLSDKAPTKPTTTDSPPALQEAAAEPQQVVQVPTAGKDRQEEEERTAMKPPRICQCKPGCTEIAKSNASPYAKGHNPNLKKKAARLAARKSKASPPRNSVSRSAPKPNGIATLCVTEQHLDSFWMRLSLEEKANLFQRQLEGA